MGSYLLAISIALVAWWFSTGLILLLNHRPRSTYWLSFSAASLVLAGSLFYLPSVSAQTGQADAILAFILALLIWGWLEMGYLMGIITGPRNTACPAVRSERQRFKLALGTSIYHELAVVFLGVCIIALTWGEPNQVATQSFICLWLMRWSCKLNIFLGVRNYNGQWLPPQLHYLDSYTRRRTMNPLFPLSVTLGTLAAVHFFAAAHASHTAFGEVGNLLVATLIALAVIEHVFLMLPLGEAVLWRWAVKSTGDAKN